MSEKCVICDTETLTARPLTIRYGNWKVSMLVCDSCMSGNFNEIAQEIKEKALWKFEEGMQYEKRD